MEVEFDALLEALRAESETAPEGAIASFARRFFQRGRHPYFEELRPAARLEVLRAAFEFFADAPGDTRLRVEASPDGRQVLVETHLPDRPFIVDTIRSCLEGEGALVRHLVHPLFAVERDDAGAIRRMSLEEGEGLERESLVHCVLTRVGPDDVERLRAALESHLGDLALATTDYPKMLGRVDAIRKRLLEHGAARGATDVDEVAAFLRWMSDGAFVFLGYRSYTIRQVDGRAAIQVDADSGLGILRDVASSSYAEARFLEELPEEIADRISGGPVLSFDRTRSHSRVHRRARMDSIGVKRLDEKGAVFGEHRILGLFSASAHDQEAAEVPILRGKLRRLLQAEDVQANSHDHREIFGVFNSLPMTELLMSSESDLRAEVQAILDAGTPGEVHVRSRVDPLQRGVSLLVILPRERFSAEVRRFVQETLAERYGGVVTDYRLALGEGGQARLHFHVATAKAPRKVADADIELELAAAIRSWDDQLQAALTALVDVEKAAALAEAWGPRFDRHYRSSTGAQAAAADVLCFERVKRGATVELGWSDPGLARPDGTAVSCLNLYVADAPLVLSDFLPVLEGFGLRVFREESATLASVAIEDTPAFLHRFFVQDDRGAGLDLARLGDRLATAISQVQRSRMESDSLNALVTRAALDHREVECLRTYRNLAFQMVAAPSRRSLTEVLTHHPSAAAALVAHFRARFDPALEASARDAAITAAREAFHVALEAVETAGEDRMLRCFADLVAATTRTNWFLPLREAHPYVAVKVATSELDWAPRPRPLFEIYVHSPWVEGVHLRGGRVARGGLRFSDRHDDFRTEILGLVKTQTVKNAVIVPEGSKGGFIAKFVGRAAEAAEQVEESYRTFVSALLDLTDDLRDGQVVAPEGVVRHDGDDPYLVVAADKGTATFSDLANAIATERGYWLGDAFASGGSVGYDHKKYGITARGAWECARHLFRELGKKLDADPIEVVGIGDMSGDVFGNGLLLSAELRLRAAFDHRHVFLDPSPDAERSFAERKRLFALPRSSWEDFSRDALGPGACIVPRRAKVASLTPEAREMLGLRPDEAIDGDALVRAVLRLRVDMLFNGGIGTYVRATTESDAFVGDPANDGVRVTARELGARVVVEGGNLMLTQAARVELASAGTRLDTDAIHNSGGVDLSDHEVNLKVLLRPLVAAGSVTPVQRGRLLESMAPSVVASVLEHNARQSMMLSLEERRSRERLLDFEELLDALVATGTFDRDLEVLPSASLLQQRRGRGEGLVRPELAVLSAWVKLRLTRELLEEAPVDDPAFRPLLEGYFPAEIRDRYAEAIGAHPLRREIIAMELANRLVDTMGATFAFRSAREFDVAESTVAVAWFMATRVATAEDLWRVLGGAHVPVADALRMRLDWSQSMESATRAVLRWMGPFERPEQCLQEWGAGITVSSEAVELWASEAEQVARSAEVAKLEALLPAGFARHLVALASLAPAIEVAALADQVARPPGEAAEVRRHLRDRIDLAWIEAQLVHGVPSNESPWRRQLRAALARDVSDARNHLVIAALSRPEAGVADRVSALLAERAVAQRKLADLLSAVGDAPHDSLDALALVVRGFRELAQPSS